VYKTLYSDRSGLEFLGKCDIKVERVTSQSVLYPTALDPLHPLS
jgi:hypothetical protein